MIMATSERLRLIMDNVSSGITAVVLKDNMTETILANRQYYDMLGYTDKEYNEYFIGDIGPIVPEDKPHVLQELELVHQTKTPTVLEYRVKHKDGHIIWISQRSSLTELTGIKGMVRLSVFVDITADKESAQKLLESSRQLRFLNETAHDLLIQTDTVGSIESVLKKTMEYFGSTHAYVYEIDYEQNVTRQTYEVGTSVISEGNWDVRKFTPEVLSLWEDVFEHKKYVDICLDEISEQHTEELELLKSKGINSLLLVPLYQGIQRQFIGFMGLSNSTRNKTHIEHLVALGDYLSLILNRRELNAKIESDRENFVALMGDIPGGFSRMKVQKEGELVPVYINEGLCKMIGMKPLEVMRNYEENFMWAVHPEDKEIVQSALEEMLDTGEARSMKYRMKHGNGGYVWVTFFGRAVMSTSGSMYLNVYYGDMTAEEKRELSFRETLPFVLSAIMESTSDLAFAKDKDLKYICCSHEFVRMFGLGQMRDVIGKTDYELFGKEYADQFRADDEELLNNGKALIDKVEAIPSIDGTLHYSSTSKYLLRDIYGHVIGLYGVSRDITEYRTTFERLKLLTDHTPSGLVMYEVTPKQIRTIYFNDGFYNYSGYSREEFAERIEKNPLFLVFEEDIPSIRAAIAELQSGRSSVVDFSYRCHTKDGGHRWFQMKGAVSEKHGDISIVNIVKLDVTERKEMENRLRMSEEQLRIAINNGGGIMARYDIATDTYCSEERFLMLKGEGQELKNIPQAFFDIGVIASSSVGCMRKFFEQIRSGLKKCRVDVEVRVSDEKYRWYRCDATIVFDALGQPAQAILVFYDITEQMEKEVIYRKWKQSLKERGSESYTLFRCNLSKNSLFDSVEGNLLKIRFEDKTTSFNARTKEYADQFVHPEDYDKYVAVLNSERLIESYHQGMRTDLLEYREMISENEVAWRLLSIDLIQYPNSTDIEVHLMYEDISEMHGDTLE